MNQKKIYIPQRGDIVFVNFSPQKGHEQAGKRPALVLSPRDYNEISGLAFCCPITRTRRNHPFEILLSKGLKTTGSVLAEHLRSLAWQERKVAFIEVAPVEILQEVTLKISALIFPKNI